MYTFAIRYYGLRTDAVLPAIKIDGKTAFDERPVPQNPLDVYEMVRGRSPFIFLALHSYVYPLLLLRAWLPRALVRRELLPVGNPETTFKYGTVEKGERVQIALPPESLRTQLALLTIYNRASFPIAWFALSEAVFETAPIAAQGVWVLRLHPRGPEAPA